LGRCCGELIVRRCSIAAETKFKEPALREFLWWAAPLPGVVRARHAVPLLKGVVPIEADKVRCAVAAKWMTMRAGLAGALHEN
jgi:hypothetical protein